MIPRGPFQPLPFWLILCDHHQVSKCMPFLPSEEQRKQSHERDSDAYFKPDYNVFSCSGMKVPHTLHNK